MPHANGHAYVQPRPTEVYTLRDADAQIPPEIRAQYQTDDEGRVLFFTTPPLNRPHPGVAEENATLGHSVRFLSGLQEAKANRKRLREERDEKNKAARAEQLARDHEAREKREKDLGAAAGAMLGDYILGLQASNILLDENVASFRAEKAAWDAEHSAQSKQKQVA